MNEKYDPNSINAVLSRIETALEATNEKLDSALETQGKQETAINKIWAALGRTNVRVAIIGAASGGGVVGLIKLFSH